MTITAFHLRMLDALGKDSFDFFGWITNLDRPVGLDAKEFGNEIQTLIDEGYVVEDINHPKKTLTRIIVRQDYNHRNCGLCEPLTMIGIGEV